MKGPANRHVPLVNTQDEHKVWFLGPGQFEFDQCLFRYPNVADQRRTCLVGDEQSPFLAPLGAGLLLPTGYKSREAGSFLAQLDDQSERLFRDLEGITPAELQWQPTPGMNTIGMLLTHNAIVEVFWSQIGVAGIAPDDAALGIDMMADGIPLAPDAAPPAGLAGKPMSYFRDLLDRARACAQQTAMQVADADMEAMRARTRRNGREEEFNVRWVLYHMLEHFAGHYGQILLLRHHYRSRKGAV